VAWRCEEISVPRAILDELLRADGTEPAIEAAIEMPRADFLPLLEALHASAPEAERVRVALECRRTGPAL
jgi:hypothetical protein